MSQEGQIIMNDSRFYCCFGKCHALKGAKIIAVIFAVVYVLCTVFPLMTLASENSTNKVGTIIGSFIGIFAVGCLWYGLTKEREGFLIPFLVYVIIGMVVAGIWFVVLSVSIFMYGNNLDVERIGHQFHQGRSQSSPINFTNGYSSTPVHLIFFMMLGVIAAFFWLYVLAFCTVKKAYSYIKQKRWSNVNGTAVSDFKS